MSNSYSAIQALQAQQRLQQAASADAAAAVATPTASSSGGSFNFFSTQEVVSTGTSDSAVGWTTYNSNQVPSTAQAVILQVTGRRNSSVTGFQYIYARASSAGTSVTIYGSNSGGIDTDTEGSTAQFLCPCSNGTFQWSMDAGIDPYTITLIGYFG